VPDISELRALAERGAPPVKTERHRSSGRIAAGLFLFM
jgi:hypothetical protein